MALINPNRKAERELYKLRYTLDNMRGIANDRLVGKISKKAGNLFVRNIRRQILKKGWSRDAARQPEIRPMKQKYRATFRGGTYTHVVLHDTPKGSKKAPHMRFQDWGTSNVRTKTIWHDVKGKDYQEWEDVEVKAKGIPAQNFSKKAWQTHHRAAERIMLNDFLKALRQMAETQRKIRNPALETRAGWGDG